MTLPELRIHGNRFSTLEEFYDEVERVLIGGAAWGRNLDAFNDILRGGFGTPEGGFILRWQDSFLSRERLGYAETVQQLHDELRRCQPSNRDGLGRKLKSAMEGVGPTVFDRLVEIIRDHGRGGRHPEDGVCLLLE
ncbi:MAG: barstar family protein [Phycisphaerales bacterium]|nr:barstar family protein [Phycisphaerales bacterium]